MSSRQEMLAWYERDVRSRIKYRPILFSTPMVLAIIRKQKTETRRIGRWSKIEPGWHLLVKEKWAMDRLFNNLPPSLIPKHTDLKRAKIWYATSKDTKNRGRWRSSIHMPKWATRIELAIESKRDEPLHAITEEGARAEGCPVGHPDPVRWFRELWDTINGENPAKRWDKNPTVTVVKFSMYQYIIR